jgi:ABC-type glycerol-3-phosphate transport system permease component
MPADLFDAAHMDGLGHFRCMLKIALPLARPVVATLALYLFIAKWNDYLWPLIVTNTQNMRTLPVGLAMVRNAEYIIGPEHLMAASLFVLVPVLIVFFAAQKQLIEGIAAGALKGRIVVRKEVIGRNAVVHRVRRTASRAHHSLEVGS